MAVTQGILEVLDWDELRGVLAHEISHVGNRDILIASVAAAVAMGITFVARMADVGRHVRRAATTTTGANPIAAPRHGASWPRSPPASSRWRSRRSREFEADRTGARLIGDGEPLARALEQARRRRPAASR